MHSCHRCTHQCKIIPRRNSNTHVRGSDILEVDIVNKVHDACCYKNSHTQWRPATPCKECNILSLAAPAAKKPGSLYCPPFTENWAFTPSFSTENDYLMRVLYRTTKSRVLLYRVNDTGYENMLLSLP